MPPQEQMSKNGTNSGKFDKSIVSIIVAFVALLLIFVLFSIVGKDRRSGNNLDGQGSDVTEESVFLNAVDINNAQTDAEKLPEGFPRDIPVELETITVSDTKVYTDRPVPITVHTVNYTTTSTALEKYNQYLDYMTRAGFEFAENGRDEGNHALNGTKNGDSLLVVASSLNGETVVQISYTENN